MLATDIDVFDDAIAAFDSGEFVEVYVDGMDPRWRDECKGFVGNQQGDIMRTMSRARHLGAGLAFVGAVAATGCGDESSSPVLLAPRSVAQALNPSARLDQCANGSSGGQVCTWVNGDLNANNSRYVEGDFVPYRILFDGLTAGTTHSVTMEWDTLEGGTHALDYLGTYNETVSNANPCADVVSCSGTPPPSLFAIPVDEIVSLGPDDTAGTADDIVQTSGVFTFFGGSITSVSGYTRSGTTSVKTSVTITFTASIIDPVLAWSGHIATRVNWSPEPSAVTISGAPYHMRLLDLDGKGGNQDRSLQSSAVYALPELIVIKHVVNENARSLAASDFELFVSGTQPNPASFPGSETGTVVFLQPGDYVVTETQEPYYVGTFSADCSGTIDWDQTKTCIVTNTDPDPCTGVVCGPPDSCQAAGVCIPETGLCEYELLAAGTECRVSTGACDPAEVCDGSSDTCPEDTLASPETVCRSAAGMCDRPEQCTGASAECPADEFAVGLECRTSAGVCDVPEQCSGTSPQCPVDQFAPTMTTCRGEVGLCDVPETCTGSSPECPADLFAVGNECRGSAGICDVPETCTGLSPQCPSDEFVSSATTCRGSAGICDVPETCTGFLPECPADRFAEGLECRGSAGICDVPEQCSGLSPECPLDAFVSSSTTCRDKAGVCDESEQCTGFTAECPQDGFAIGQECRGPADVCDVAETCDGSGADCPSDKFVSSATTCRDEAGLCDVPEQCSGESPFCPPDEFAVGIECRGEAGLCDVPEQCLGDSPECPVDEFLSSSTTCRDEAGLCDLPEQCSGESPVCPPDKFAADIECRASAGICDAPEQCSGDSAECPRDGFLSSSTTCRDKAGVCDEPEQCTGTDVDCPPDDVASSGTLCRFAAGECDVAELCTGVSVNCPEDVKSNAECRASADGCDPAEFCDGMNDGCPADLADTCTLCGMKFYDANIDGTFNDSDVRLQGWSILLTGDETTQELTASDGIYAFDGLPAGTFMVCEATPQQTNWVQTAPTPRCWSVTTPSRDGEDCLLDFGNVCLAGGGGRTLGFWSNKNGSRLVTAGALTMLRGLNLKDGNGTDFDPTTYSALRTWLLNATATSMGFMLSAQLAAMELNVFTGLVSAQAHVYAPAVSGADANGVLTISTLMTTANTALNTPMPPMTRAVQEALKNALDDANNNRNFVSPTACSFTFATRP
jgi:hypothetical protein